jgi:acetyltransferase-like isoleucine patch superfamily enzyme
MQRRRLFKFVAEQLTPLHHDYAKWERKNRWLRRAGLNISPTGVVVNSGFTCLLGNEQNITFLDYAVIGYHTRFWNFGPITIGKFCLIAAETSLANGGHDTSTLVPFSGPLSIGNGCWIGTRAQIVGPLTIGENAIVGAVVIRDVEPGTIVAGVPARVVGKRKLPDKVWHLGGLYFSPHTHEIVS